MAPCTLKFHQKPFFDIFWCMGQPAPQSFKVETRSSVFPTSHITVETPALFGHICLYFCMKKWNNSFFFFFSLSLQLNIWFWVGLHCVIAFIHNTKDVRVLFIGMQVKGRTKKSWIYNYNNICCLPSSPCVFNLTLPICNSSSICHNINVSLWEDVTNRKYRSQCPQDAPLRVLMYSVDLTFSPHTSLIVCFTSGASVLAIQ